jgi:hypothetical protein
MLDTATGEAVYASMSPAALWVLLVRKGVISQDAKDTIDHTLLVLERARETRPDGGPRALDHARERLEALLRQV